MMSNSKDLEHSIGQAILAGVPMRTISQDLNIAPPQLDLLVAQSPIVQSYRNERYAMQTSIVRERVNTTLDHLSCDLEYAVNRLSELMRSKSERTAMRAIQLFLSEFRDFRAGEDVEHRLEEIERVINARAIDTQPGLEGDIGTDHGEL